VGITAGAREYREEKACDRRHNNDDDDDGGGGGGGGDDDDGDDMLLQLTGHNSVRYIRHTTDHPAVLHATAQYIKLPFYTIYCILDDGPKTFRSCWLILL